ncbi:stage II sporulation protein M [Candidatus Woesearchaeota archaeon]|nr:stage II sporulation protein M [Candidatus Woesearchaeota archaeon]
MVLESLVDAVKAEKKPGEMIIIGFVYAVIGTLLGIWVFKQYSSMVSVFLVTMASIPLVYSTIKYEEEKDLQDVEEKFLLKEHGKALTVFIMLFIGISLGFFFMYMVMPPSMVGYAFKAQAETISAINSRAIIDTGISGYLSSGLRIFVRILANNFKVLMFCVLFSFLYGLGAIFIMTWNASVIATAMGNFARTELAKIAANSAPSIAHYLQVVPLAILRYSIHGVVEILAYFTAGLAGGIISVAVIRHDFYTRKFEHIIVDSSDLLILSIILLIIAAFLEVYVTPLIV